MPTAAKTVDQYLARLPDDRRRVIEAIRAVILDHIDPAFEEGIQYGMIGYYVPHSVYPAGYHVNPQEPLPFASIGSQKSHIGLYLFCVYMDDALQAWFRDAWLGSGRKLDMGKSCVRVKKLEDVPLDVVGELFDQVRASDFVRVYEAGRAGGAKKRKSPAKKANRKAKKPAKARKKRAAPAKRAGAAARPRRRA